MSVDDHFAVSTCEGSARYRHNGCVFSRDVQLDVHPRTMRVPPVMRTRTNFLPSASPTTLRPSRSDETRRPLLRARTWRSTGSTWRT